ncbi:tannase and feruloyl esterase [Wilcoxina mikolae CBS 423.85]|nr:tannase and feruloyl esterase [Wilcoxina mikolae CBS 423.85]
MPSIRLLPTSALSLASALFFGVDASAIRYGGSEHCQKFGSQLKLDKTTVLHTTYIASKQTFDLPGASMTCDLNATASSPLCRISLLVDTSSSSQVQMEIWLPDEWSGRVATVGNGGLNGCIDYSNLDYLSSFNFAVVGSNNGHNGTSGKPFLNAPEVIKDFAWRAIHTEAKISKKIAKSYYSRPHTKSYYVGCSTGGRQGFRAVQDFPKDFDGVLAGAPAFDFNHLQGWSAMLSRYTGAPSGTPTISSELLQVVAKDVIAQCDMLDGVKDGIIDNPDRCDYRPEALLCDKNSASGALCLTASQVETVRKIFSPLYGSEGELLYPRYDPGAGFSGPAMLMFGGNLFPFAQDWARYAVYNDSSYTGSDYGLKVIEDADAVNAAGISTWKFDLSAFNNRKGKVITYHGRSDPLIASGNSLRYYNAVERTMGTKAMENFYRLFTAPGMSHCNGGVGANAFGQIGRAAPGVAKDSKHNLVLALLDWVEKGVAPEQIIGTKFVNDTAALGVVGQRVHCAYPKKSVLVMGGDWKKAEAWTCVD